MKLSAPNRIDHKIHDKNAAILQKLAFAFDTNVGFLSIGKKRAQTVNV